MSAASLSDDRPVDPDDESLVAYLDGELAAEDRDALERRLLEEDALRGRLRELQHSWDLLEELPSATPNEKMVESTLEMVVSDVVRASPERPMWHKVRGPLVVFAALLLPPLVAFGAVAWKRTADYRRELEMLAVAENVDAYLQADDLELMRELATNERWNRMILAAREVGLIPYDTSPIVASVPVGERESTLEALDADQRSRLATRWDRFQQLAPETRQRVEATHRQVRQQTDAASLVRTMKDYSAWKETLRPRLTDDMEGRSKEARTDAARRSAAIEMAITDTIRDLTERSGMALDDATAREIYHVLEEIVRMRLRSGDSATSALVDYLEERSRNVAEMIDEDPRDIATRSAIVVILRADSGRRPFRFGPPLPDDLEPVTPLSHDELEWIRVVLPREEQRRLDLIAGDDSGRLAYLRAWAEEAFQRTSPYQRRRDEHSTRYFALPAGLRDRVDLDDPAKLARHLSWGRGRGSNGPSPPRGPRRDRGQRDGGGDENDR